MSNETQHIHGYRPQGLEETHAHTSDEWTRLQSDRDSLARINKRGCDEWADDHTYLQALCRKAGASIDEVEGGDDGMLTLQDLADMLESKLRAECAAKDAEIARLRTVLQQIYTLPVSERKWSTCMDIAGAALTY